MEAASTVILLQDSKLEYQESGMGQGMRKILTTLLGVLWTLEAHDKTKLQASWNSMRAQAPTQVQQLWASEPSGLGTPG